LHRPALLNYLSQPVPHPLLGGSIALARLIGNSRKDRLIEGFPLGSQVLVVTHQACQPVASGG
jgi:hypothetical protein